MIIRTVGFALYELSLCCILVAVRFQINNFLLTNRIKTYLHTSGISNHGSRLIGTPNWGKANDFRLDAFLCQIQFFFIILKRPVDSLNFIVN